MKRISKEGSNKRNRSRKARVEEKVQRNINERINAEKSTREGSSKKNFVKRQKRESIFGEIQKGRSLKESNRGKSGLEKYGWGSNLKQDFLKRSG